MGNPAALEPEFAKENGARSGHDLATRFMHRHLNKAIHGVIVLYFTLGCWFLWGLMQVARMTVLGATPPFPLPAFTILCLALTDFWYVPPALAALYCAFVWSRPRPTAIRGPDFSRSSQPFWCCFSLPRSLRRCCR